MAGEKYPWRRNPHQTLNTEVGKGGAFYKVMASSKGKYDLRGVTKGNEEMGNDTYEDRLDGKMSSKPLRQPKERFLVF